MAKLAIIFFVVPVVELYLLLLLGDLLGFWPTLAVVLATALVGAWLAKREGWRALRRWRASLGEGRMPQEGVLGGLLLLVGGVLLVTPGVMTDLVGLALLVPRSRAAIADWLRPRIERRIRRSMDQGTVQVIQVHSGFGTEPSEPPSAHRVIDTEGTDVTDEHRRS